MKVEDGTITAANGKTITYWELVTGKELEREATGTAKPAADLGTPLYRQVVSRASTSRRR